MCTSWQEAAREGIASLHEAAREEIGSLHDDDESNDQNARAGPDHPPENVLIANAAQRLGCRVMLCDFGLCARLPGHNGGAVRKDEAYAAGLTDFAGSPGFYAPEVGSSLGREAVAYTDISPPLTALREATHCRARFDAPRAPA